MNFELNDRIAMVSAASKGLGKATAIALAQEGCKVSICARNEEELQRTKEEIGPKCFAMKVDVSKLDELEKWHAQTRKHFGGEVDILVTNTGGPPAARFMQLTD
jgi:3-oxoacyl-[acyl-carrier protein] reductase